MVIENLLLVIGRGLSGSWLGLGFLAALAVATDIPRMRDPNDRWKIFND
jgi:hypothetical protein